MTLAFTGRVGYTGDNTAREHGCLFLSPVSVFTGRVFTARQDTAREHMARKHGLWTRVVCTELKALGCSTC